MFGFGASTTVGWEFVLDTETVVTLNPRTIEVPWGKLFVVSNSEDTGGGDIVDERKTTEVGILDWAVEGVDLSKDNEGGFVGGDCPIGTGFNK